jgi:hypothetical protein
MLAAPEKSLPQAPPAKELTGALAARRVSKKEKRK